ncbi:MAG: hypothetical protein ACHQ1F_09055 [Spirochaetia bacterium]
MRWVLLIVGILLVLLGAVWVLQGTNVLTGSAVMSGHFSGPSLEQSSPS